MMNGSYVDGATNPNNSGAAVGAAIAYNYVGKSFDDANPAVVDHSEPSGSSSQAYIDNSNVTVGGDLQVSAGYSPSSPLPDTTTANIDGGTDNSRANVG